VHLTPSVNRAFRWKLAKRGATETRQRFPNPADLFRNVKGAQAKSTDTVPKSRGLLRGRLSGKSSSPGPEGL